MTYCTGYAIIGSLCCELTEETNAFIYRIYICSIKATLRITTLHVLLLTSRPKLLPEPTIAIRKTCPAQWNSISLWLRLNSLLTNKVPDIINTEQCNQNYKNVFLKTNWKMLCQYINRNCLKLELCNVLVNMFNDRC